MSTRSKHALYQRELKPSHLPFSALLFDSTDIVERFLHLHYRLTIFFHECTVWTFSTHEALPLVSRVWIWSRCFLAECPSVTPTLPTLKRTGFDLATANSRLFFSRVTTEYWLALLVQLQSAKSGSWENRLTHTSTDTICTNSSIVSALYTLLATWSSESIVPAPVTRHSTFTYCVVRKASL